MCCSDWISNGADDALPGCRYCVAYCNIGSSQQSGFVYLSVNGSHLLFIFSSFFI